MSYPLVVVFVVSSLVEPLRSLSSLVLVFAAFPSRRLRLLGVFLYRISILFLESNFSYRSSAQLSLAFSAQLSLAFQLVLALSLPAFPTFPTFSPAQACKVMSTVTDQQEIASELSHILTQIDSSPVFDGHRLVHAFREKCKSLAATDIGCVLFHKSTVMAVTQVWIRVWGYSEREIVGNTLKLLQGPESMTLELSMFEDKLRGRQSPAHAQLRNYTKHGKCHSCLVSAFPVGKEHYISFVNCLAEPKLPNQENFPMNTSQAAKSDSSRSEIKDFFFGLEETAQPEYHMSKMHTSNKCNLAFAMYEFFWHSLFYFTGPFSLIIIVPVCGTGFARVHGFLPDKKCQFFRLVVWITEHLNFCLVAWSTYRGIMTHFHADALSKGIENNTTLSNSTYLNWEDSPYWKCTSFELDVGTPIFFLALRLFVLLTKYGRMTDSGRRALLHKTNTEEERKDFFQKTLLVAWAGTAFDPKPTKLAVEIEFNNNPELKDTHIVLAKTQREARKNPPIASSNPMVNGLKDKERLSLELTSRHEDRRNHALTMSETIQGTSKHFQRCRKLDNSLDSGVVTTTVYDAVMTLCTSTGEHNPARTMVLVMFMATLPTYIALSLFIRYRSGRLPRQIPTCKDTVVADEVFLALSLLVGGNMMMAITMFFGVVYIDLRRRHSQMTNIGKIIHHLILESPENALAWLRARRVLVNVGSFYLERMGYFLMATGLLFVFMLGWSIELSSRPADEPLPLSYPIFLFFCLCYQFLILMSLREAGLANATAKRHAKEWCYIRSQLIAELGKLQGYLIQKKNTVTQVIENKPTSDKKSGHTARRKRRVSAKWSISAPKLSRFQRCTNKANSIDAYYKNSNSQEIERDISSLKTVELSVSSCIDELSILNLSYPLTLHKIPLSMALFRALVGLFYTQTYVLLVYTFRILNSSADTNEHL